MNQTFVLNHYCFWLCVNLMIVFCCYFRLVEDVDLQLVTFEDFGKNVPKTYKLSPDGFIQIAIQLAYYRYVCSTEAMEDPLQE